MITIISPAKSLDFERESLTSKYTMPEFLDDTFLLIDILKEYSPEDISSLMKISPKLGELNFYRYQNFNNDFKKDTKQALFAFNGDVYKGIDAYSYNVEDINFAQNHLRILSGLYGILKPLDLIKEYRLEMGIKLKNSKGKDLYSFWGNKITRKIEEDIMSSKENVILNLASEEYSKVINRDILKNSKVYDVVFKEKKNGVYKIIAIYAKKARGTMASYIIKNKIDSIEEVKNFDEDGYEYREDLSSESILVFTREL
ncbi:peroxide stress protein YaaA [Hathewaya histolytica]|uniref:peroxide stress protein YaaA n=1 Tax=Hathewaya histolytica TaxID=1498 RepID=UPI003B673EB3